MMYTTTNKDAPNIMHIIPPGSRGAEIGVWMGNTSREFLARGVEHLYLVDSYSVEPYKNNSEATYDMYLAKYSKITGEFTESGFSRYYDTVYKNVLDKFKGDSRVTLCRMTSDEWFANQDDNILDWIYVDGDHSYEGCLRDLNNALSKVKKGGMILGDDYGHVGARWQKPGVTKAVNEFCFENDFIPIRHGETQFQINT